MVGRIDVNHAFVAALIPSPLPVTSGGTGRTALTNHAVLLGENTSPVNGAAPGAAGTVLRSIGAGSDPAFGAIQTSDLPAPWNSYSGGAWTAYSPTITAPGAGSLSATGTADYLQIGKITFVLINMIVTFVGVPAFIALSYPPVSPITDVYSPGRESALTGKMFVWRSSDGTFIDYSGAVFTGSGSQFAVNASYEAA